MITSARRQSGFTLIEALIILAVIAVIGALGYTFYNRLNNQKASQTSQAGSSQQTANNVPTAPEITQSSDLDKAEAVLNQTDPSANSSDTSQLDTMSSSF